MDLRRHTSQVHDEQVTIANLKKDESHQIPQTSLSCILEDAVRHNQIEYAEGLLPQLDNESLSTLFYQAFGSLQATFSMLERIVEAMTARSLFLELDTAWLHAVNAENLSAVKYLINGKVPMPKHLFKSAVEALSPELVALLVQNGIQEGIEEDSIFTFYRIKEFQGSETDLLRRLTQLNQYVNNKKINQMGLYFAVEARLPRVAEYFLENGADINCNRVIYLPPYPGREIVARRAPVLYRCIRYASLKDVEMVKFLLQHGANPRIQRITELAGMKKIEKWLGKTWDEIVLDFGNAETAVNG